MNRWSTSDHLHPLSEYHRGLAQPATNEEPQVDEGCQTHSGLRTLGYLVSREVSDSSG